MAVVLVFESASIMSIRRYQSNIMKGASTLIKSYNRMMPRARTVGLPLVTAPTTLGTTTTTGLPTTTTSTTR